MDFRDIESLPDRPGMPTDRLCPVCHQPVVELRKAATIPVGYGLEAVGHTACLEDLLAVKMDRALHEALELLSPAERADWLVNHVPLQKHL